MDYKITHSTTYTYSEPVAVCHNQVLLTPRDDGRAHCRSHRLTIRPTPTTSSRRVDFFGNHVHAFSIEEQHRQLSISSTCRVNVQPPAAQVSERGRKRLNRMARVLKAADIPLHVWTDNALPSVDAARETLMPKPESVSVDEARAAAAAAPKRMTTGPSPLDDDDRDSTQDERIEMRDPRVRRFVRDALAGAGHEVTAVRDAESAVARLLAFRPDVFVIDIHLPGMDGLSLARKLRRIHARRPVPVVVISARTDPHHKVSAHASGAITFLEKPFRREDLLDAVRLALGVKSRREK